MVVIPEQYWIGDKCIETRTPWMVPGAIHALDKHLTKDDIVLEFGSGGSTLFYADRCKKVISFELDALWGHLITNIIGREGISNVEHHTVTSIFNACDILAKMYPTQKFNIVDVDWTENRDFFSSHLTTRLFDRFILILDNYSATDLFYIHHNKDYIANLPIKAYVKIYDDGHWWGQGTKIYSSECLTD